MKQSIRHIIIKTCTDISESIRNYVREIILIIIENDLLLPFPVVAHITKVSFPNPTELLALTLKVLGVRFKIMIIVLLVIILISSGVPVIL